MTKGQSPRRAALGALLAVTEGRKPLSEVLADPATGFSDLAPQDRARAQRLVLSTLRRALPADAALAPHLRKDPAPEVRAILRMAVVELADRPQDAHGIVDAAVTLCRQVGAAPAAGFVNAVLRKLAGTGFALTTQKLPGWLRRQLVQAWGKEAVAAMEAAHQAGAALDLTLRDASQAVQWADRLVATALPTGSLRLQGGQVTALPGYDSGDWWVQDAAAALPAQVLAAQKGARVLDLCAAPGGKTLQLAANGAEVTSLDVSEKRVGRLRANLARTGLKAEVVIADMLDWTPPAPFDAILLDAPCSATGTIRRHPDLPFLRTRAEVDSLIALQAQMIDRALGWLKPGGRLVFCTCSILRAEGEDQITEALLRHDGVELDPAATAPFPAEFHARPGELRLLPSHWADRGGIDGFYIAALKLG